MRIRPFCWIWNPAAVSMRICNPTTSLLRIANADTQGVRIANPHEQVNTILKCIVGVHLKK